MVTLDVLFTGFFTAPRFRMTSIFFAGASRCARMRNSRRRCMLRRSQWPIPPERKNGKIAPCPLFLLYNTRTF